MGQKIKINNYTFEFDMSQVLIPLFINTFKSLLEIKDEYNNKVTKQKELLKNLQDKKDYKNPSYSSIKNDLSAFDFIYREIKRTISDTFFLDENSEQTFYITYETLSLLLRNVDYLNYTIERNIYEY